MTAIALSDFFDLYDWLPSRWAVQRNDEVSGLGSGRIIAAELAPPLWIMTLEAKRLSHSKAARLIAQLDALRGPSVSFLVRSSLHIAPSSDPSGSGLSGFSPTIAAITGDRDQMTLQGLPAGYTLSAGDKISLSHGSPSIVDMLQVSGLTVTANSSGDAGPFAVFPFVPVGVAAGAAVTLRNPPCEVMLIPGTRQDGKADGNAMTGISFQVVQKR